MSFGQITILVYALLMLVGGLIGYLKAGSQVSLIAGSASFLLLCVAFVVTRSQLTGGLVMGAVLAVALTANFGKRLADSGKFMPSGAMLVVSAIVAVILVAAVLKSRSA